jgi:hydrogenase maturation protease
MANASLQRIIIIGVGNVLFKDEGLGVYASQYLATNYVFDSSVEVLDGACLGFALMPYFQEYDVVILIDTVSIEDQAGAIYRLPAEEMLGLGSYRQTAHEVEIVEMLEICSLLDQMAEVVVIGIVPEDIKSVEMDLSDSLLGAFSDLIAVVLQELARHGIDAHKSHHHSLESIILSLSRCACYSREVRM